MERWTDEEIWERACAERGCTNLSERGYTLCGGHLYGWKPEKLPEAAAKRKLEMEQEDQQPDSGSCYFDDEDRDSKVDPVEFLRLLKAVEKILNNDDNPEWNTGEPKQEKTNPDSVLGMLEKAKKRLSDGWR